MGELAFVGWRDKVNGVSALHSGLMKETVFKDLHALPPGPDREPDQRRHAAALAHNCNPASA